MNEAKTKLAQSRAYFSNLIWNVENLYHHRSLLMYDPRKITLLPHLTLTTAPSTAALTRFTCALCVIAQRLVSSSSSAASFQTC